MISHLHHQIGVIKEYWKDDISEIENTLKNFEILLNKKMNNIYPVVKKISNNNGLTNMIDELKLDLRENFNEIYEFFTRDREFPEVERYVVYY